MARREAMRLEKVDLSPQQADVLMECANQADGRIPVARLVDRAVERGQTIGGARVSVSRRIHRLAQARLLILEPPRRARVVQLSGAGWDMIGDFWLTGDGPPSVNTQINGRMGGLAWWKRLLSKFVRMNGGA
jgi:hypothetical protein